MKKILTAFLAVLLCLSLAACFTIQADASNNTDTYAMEKVAEFSDRGLTIYREPVTDVLYIVYDGYSAGGMTVMLDPETGLPMTFANYLEQYSEMFLEGGK